MDWAIIASCVGITIAVIVAYLELKSRTERTEHKLDLLLRHCGFDPSKGLPLSDRVKELARDPHRKIQAIKAHRDETGASLRDAKDAVEAYAASL